MDKFSDPMVEKELDGRTGRVSAGCVFWIKAIDSSFYTDPQDHGNCSVGSLTHGLLELGDIASNSDVAELLDSGWVNMDMVLTIPAVSKKPKHIGYGLVNREAFLPDVVLCRVNGRQLMVISDAVPNMKIEGKPQCHIVAVAHETNTVAASVGCALSRARTGMQPSEMTVAIPIARFEEVVASVERALSIDTKVAKYAATDARRFESVGSGR